MWDEYYASDEYIYGTAPNAFLAEHAGLLAGPVLSVAEGEGRNAAFLASIGLDVLGVDSSAVGLAKAHKLAALKGVAIRTEIADFAAYMPPEGAFGAVVSIFAHMPSRVRKRLHGLAAQALRPGGIILLEAYSKAQLTRDTGGPDDLDMLMAGSEIEQEFPQCNVLLSREIERDVIEGTFHTGLACVVQFIARRR
ncbi:SAM-dependent methyltransferase [Pseudomonas wadenswilerensis]|uniref:SAM-dependent methyltransferase n=1 Tax=Pseudomonas wadenswilerensis TaxID=1785161 RepID=UPI00215EED00|nr:class I SAM-dependent methyltransferase [Pseudomonas wadenswilerensis]UVM24446.1 class I SAM-dependent methyltransferase [Pseudomonas wadenswilerensis]